MNPAKRNPSGMLGSPPGLPSTVRTSPDTHYIMTLLPQRQEERFFGGFCVCVCDG